MAVNLEGTWENYLKYRLRVEDLGMTLDFSRLGFTGEYLEKMEPAVQKALEEMARLEAGALANPDEGRMVGHYWLRDPELAPSLEIKRQIKENLSRIEQFAAGIHEGRVKGSAGKPFNKYLLLGIGGSSLGPQLVADALRPQSERMQPFFADNTDPDGLDRVIEDLGSFEDVLVVVATKSGKTPETRNGMLEVCHAIEEKGLDFPAQAVAVTAPGSDLDRQAGEEKWLGIFPIWDWVGGRTSVTSAVGLLPAALQGIDPVALLTGAKLCDSRTRNKRTRENPAAVLALAWHWATGGQGKKDMVILPYKDSLQLLPRYLQQLVMESLGKERDLQGNVVNQGIAVYGNKGSTDQHAYVQQLIEGVPNFFVTFVEVLASDRRDLFFVEKDITSADYLRAFLQGTREALTQKGRPSLTITLDKLDASSFGALIALYERAVGLYASLVGINAYHQPGVENGKKSAGVLLKLQTDVLRLLRNHRESSFTAAEAARALGVPERTEDVYKILEYLSLNGNRGVKKGAAAHDVSETSYSWE